MKAFADWQTRCAESGKLRYRNRRDADHVVAGMDRDGMHRERALRSYECPYCHGWHLTSKPKRY